MKTKLRSVLFLIITALTLGAVFILDTIPNHRFGYGDWSMWLTLTLFPILFLLHGILSGVILNEFRNILYYTVTPLGIFVVFASDRLISDQLGFWVSLRSALIGSVLYFTLSFLGFGLVIVFKKAFFAFSDYGKKPRDRKQG